jgi:anti-sigma factor RsiW
MVTCRDAHRFICDNLDEHLQSARCRAIRRHLATCARCREYLDSVKKTVTLYRALPAPRVPRGVHSVLLDAVRTLPQPSQPRKKPRSIR